MTCPIGSIHPISPAVVTRGTIEAICLVLAACVLVVRARITWNRTACSSGTVVTSWTNIACFELEKVYD